MVEAFGHVLESMVYVPKPKKMVWYAIPSFVAKTMEQYLCQVWIHVL